MTPTRPREAEIRANAEAYTHLGGIVNRILSPRSDQSPMYVLCSAIVDHVRDGHGHLMEYLECGRIRDRQHAEVRAPARANVEIVVAG